MQVGPEGNYENNGELSVCMSACLFFLFKYQHMSLHLIFEVPNFEECEREDESANGEGNLNSWKIRDNPLNPVVIINDSVQ